MNSTLKWMMAGSAVMLSACQASMPPLETVDYVDLERFMGDWYVIGNIPTFVEKEAYNAVESYELNDDGTIATTFTYRKGGFDGPQKTMEPKGFIVNEESNSEWAMQFIWPFKGEYLVIYLDDDYSTTIIGRNKRDYVWLMARTPTMDAAEYEAAVKYIQQVGYDVSELRKVPQRW